MTAPRRNEDVDWDTWPVQDYLAENYRELHPSDAAVIRHHSAFYRQLAPDSIARSVEFGAGPNLYPLMLAAAASRHIDAVEAGAANVAYLHRQLPPTDGYFGRTRDHTKEPDTERGPDANWRVFYAYCRRHNPALPATLPEALSRAHVVHGDIRDIPSGGYELASMNFVAESVTEDLRQFTELCERFVRSVRPGGRLVAAFMENMPSYRIGGSPSWPGCPVDRETVHAAFAPHTTELRVDRIEDDPTLPEYGDTGMVVLTAQRAAAS